MKNRLSIIALLGMLCFSLAPLTGCSSDDDNASVGNEGLSIKMISPATIEAGEEVVITGTGLDDVTSIVFPGNIEAKTFSKVGLFQLSVIAPSGFTAGNIILKNKDGKEVTSTVGIQVANPTVTNSFPAELKWNEILTIKGVDLSTVETVVFPGNIEVKAVNFFRKSAEELKIVVPNTVKDNGEVTLKTVGGKTLTTSGSITFIQENGEGPFGSGGDESSTDPITEATVMISNFNGGDNSQSTWGGVFAFGTPDVELDGTPCMIGTSVSGWTWSWAANWGTLPSLDNPNNYVFKMDIYITNPVPGVTGGMCFRGWDNSISLGELFAKSTEGKWITMSFPLNADNAINGTGDWGLYFDGSGDLTGIYIDNFRFDPKE